MLKISFRCFTDTIECLSLPKNISHPMKKLLYIHGYNGSPNGHSRTLFDELKPEGWEVLGMDHDETDCAKALCQIRDTIEREQIDVVAGSSLGGFLTLLTTGIRRYVINPCYSPSAELPKLRFLDELPTPSSALVATYQVYEPHLKSFSPVEKSLITGFFASADELLADRYLLPFTHDVSAPIPIPGGHHLTREGAAIVWRSILHDVE